ncbi:Solute carrier family 22 member 5, partial [Pseudolycoriella hygida]
LSVLDGQSESEIQTTQQSVDVVDVILADLGGTFKKYQIINYILFCIPFALSGTFALSYVFTALNLDYRCFVPECEDITNTTFKPIWLQDALPLTNGKPTTCSRYATNQFSTACEPSTFNHSSAQGCDQFVYATDEKSILSEFGLQCDDNLWKLAMVGTANNIGRFVFTPLMGFFSDRFGRRTILIVGVMGSVIFAYIRSIAPNYATFTVFEFLDAGIGSVTYSASFILAMEWIGVKDRILLVTTITATYPFGQIFLGLTARAVQNFRLLLQIIYAPGVLILIYIWVAPESIRWLIVNGHKSRVLKTLSRAERINRVQLSQNTIELITSDEREKNTESLKVEKLTQVLRKRVLLIRLLVCTFAWISSAFVSYGISLTSVSLAGDKYYNFVVIAIAGIPAMVLCYYMMEYLGRRYTLFSSLLIGGASIICSKLMPPNLSALSIILFFVGKLFITVAFTSLYIYTSELWPTNMRHSIMGLCSTMGRIGAMFAPFAPLLSQYFDILPYLTFGGMALIASAQGKSKHDVVDDEWEKMYLEVDDDDNKSIQGSIESEVDAEFLDCEKTNLNESEGMYLDSDVERSDECDDNLSARILGDTGKNYLCSDSIQSEMDEEYLEWEKGNLCGHEEMYIPLAQIDNDFEAIYLDGAAELDNATNDKDDGYMSRVENIEQIGDNLPRLDDIMNEERDDSPPLESVELSGRRIVDIGYVFKQIQTTKFYTRKNNWATTPKISIKDSYQYEIDELTTFFKRNLQLTTLRCSFSALKTFWVPAIKETKIQCKDLYLDSVDTANYLNELYHQGIYKSLHVRFDEFGSLDADVISSIHEVQRITISECEDITNTTFKPIWLQDALPLTNGKPTTCSRYATNQFSTACEPSTFNHSSTQGCDQFVYATDEKSILSEFGLQCDDNLWKLAMVGTANNIGGFVFTPLMGFFSDRFGRRTILIVGVMGSVIFAYIRSIAPNYATFTVFEFLDAGIGSVTYSASFILAMEWIGVKDRILLVTTITATYPFGQIFLGLTARAVQNFRLLLQIIYAPGVLILIYIWVAPESIRWLIVNGHKSRVLKTLSRAERINRVQLSQNTIELITSDEREKNTESSKVEKLTQVLRKRVFLIRLLVCTFAWISSAFVSYGISLTSVSLAGDKYYNFVVIAIAGIPAMVLCYYMMEYLGRRYTLFSSLLIGGASIICSKLMPPNLSALSIILFFVGKLFITVAFTSLYIYTSELWPTNMRHSIMGLCSTMGRIGAMFAPFAPLLSQYFDILPYLTFGGMALIAAVLILLLPETRNKKLPDTLYEAETIADR